MNKEKGKKLWREIITNIWDNPSPSIVSQKYRAKGYRAVKIKFACRICGAIGLNDSAYSTRKNRVCYDCKAKKKNEYGREYS